MLSRAKFLCLFTFQMYVSNKYYHAHLAKEIEIPMMFVQFIALRWLDTEFIKSCFCFGDRLSRDTHAGN